MEKFNKALYDEAVNDFYQLIKRYQGYVSDSLKKLEIELTNELWLSFVSEGSKKVREFVSDKINSNKSIYLPSPNLAPIQTVLTEIQNLHSAMIESYHRPINKANLIPLTSCGLDAVINPDALDKLKQVCTNSIDDNLVKSLEKFIKSYNEVNAIHPKSIQVESNYLVHGEDGNLELTFNKL
ncbi:hypothetical protein [Pedobacter zeae]|uniref:Thiamine kinase-like enzyme n=1 Tax=Pedobacter zeae TaxID=1737356 RepID=A0A7W6P5S4_9SPHI|nr:hypothetical protein [Pedobacter zeae]MBB4108337.1 thiamine kinase-like enzyme [Pedobacter zeae]GGG93452.1 hypothetical protein GCM10007422_03360 [Pedobacter zeae]